MLFYYKSFSYYSIRTLSFYMASFFNFIETNAFLNTFGNVNCFLIFPSGSHSTLFSEAKSSVRLASYCFLSIAFVVISCCLVCYFRFGLHFIYFSHSLTRQCITVHEMCLFRCRTNFLSQHSFQQWFWITFWCKFDGEDDAYISYTFHNFFYVFANSSLYLWDIFVYPLLTCWYSKIW